MRQKTVQLVRSARFLGRRSKQLVMVLADAIGMPAAFWAALTLRTGSVDHGFAGVALMYAVAFASTVPVFARIGLYRAVIRFMGIRAAFTMIAGVAVSALAMIIANYTMLAAERSEEH